MRKLANSTFSSDFVNQYLIIETFKITENMEIKYPKNLSFLQRHLLKNSCYLVKLGGFKDGGYVLDFRAILVSKILISGGVGSNVRFESDFKDINMSVEIILIDPTVSVLRMFVRSFYHFFVKNQSGYRDLSELFNFLSFKNKATLIKKYLSEEFSLHGIFKNLPSSDVAFLKLDIEGSEYDLLDSIIENKHRFSGICIEFHDVDKIENASKIEAFLNVLNFELVHISINEVLLTSNNEPVILELSLSPKNKENFAQSFDYNVFLQNSNSFDKEMLLFN